MERIHNIIEKITESFNLRGEAIPEDVNMLLINIPSAYISIEWPEYQEFMSEDWFREEAVADVNAGCGSYLIPINRLI